MRNTLSWLALIGCSLLISSHLSHRPPSAKTAPDAAEDNLEALRRWSGALSLPTPYVGLPCLAVDSEGVHRAARISRVRDSDTGEVDLHIDLPSAVYPVAFAQRILPGPQPGADWCWLPLGGGHGPGT